jgi:hypothetical protein
MADPIIPPVATDTAKVVVEGPVVDGQPDAPTAKDNTQTITTQSTVSTKANAAAPPTFMERTQSNLAYILVMALIVSEVAKWHMCYITKTEYKVSDVLVNVTFMVVSIYGATRSARVI